MSKVGRWSTTPSNNNSTPPDGWPEGQAPSTVNDCAREMMAQIRIMASDMQYVDLGHTPSFLTATTFSLGTADIANFQIGRRVKLYDATTMYGTIDSASGTFVSVRLDAGGELTSSLTSVALGILTSQNSGLPEAAHTQENIIINGDMEIWQRGTFFGDPANFQYTADRFMYEEFAMGGAGSVVQKRYQDSASQVPLLADAGRFITNSLQFVITATQTVLLTNSYAMLSYVVEGYDWRPVAHQKLGLGFWCATNHSGIYSVAIRNGAVETSYITQFTVTEINTMQHFFLSIPEAPITGYTWNYSASAGLRISWVYCAGTDNQATNTNEWTASNLIAGPNQVNLFDAAFNFFTITGVTLKRGWEDVPIMQRRYAEELELCHRYYWKGLPCGALNGASFAVDSILSWPISFPATMRATPTLSSVLTNSTYSFCYNPSWTAPSSHGARFILQTNAIGTNCFVTFDDDDYLTADAEL